jgi:hypothetical protein
LPQFTDTRLPTGAASTAPPASAFVTAMVATARFLAACASARPRARVRQGGVTAPRRFGPFGSWLVVLACSFGGLSAMAACGDDVQCPRGTSGDPCRPDGPVGDVPLPGEQARPDITTSDPVDVASPGDASEPPDTTPDLNDHEDDATHDDGAAASDGLSAEDAGPDAPDADDDATHDDVGADAAAACGPPSVFITTPNTRTPPSARRNAACAGIDDHDRARTSAPQGARLDLDVDGRPNARRHG